MFKPGLRLVFALAILAISLAALAWGFLPGARIVRRQKIQPTEMQLPTPSGFIPSGRYLAKLDYSNAAARIIYGAHSFVLVI